MTTQPARRRLGVLWLAMLAACSSAADMPGPRLAAGKWLYHGSIAGCEIVGVLTLADAGSAIRGRMPTAGSACIGSAGYYSLLPDSSVGVLGRLEADSAVFTLSGWGSQLRHSAVAGGDSLSGSITALLSTGLTGTGTFAARRYVETPAGRFQMVISGALNDTVEGGSYANQYGVYMERDDDLVKFELTERSDPTSYPDAPGSWAVHPFRATQDSASGFLYLASGNRIYLAREGTVTISSVNDGFIRGTFEVRAYDRFDPASTITIRGDFFPHREPML
jgi:hypothetical protein